MDSAPFAEIFKNKVLNVTIFAWFAAQTIKVLLGVIREKRFNFRWFIGTGGMPSAHTAGSAALATACGMRFGFGSGIFAIAAMFALVTMFDAQGVRRATGKQAAILNKIIEDFYSKGRTEQERLIELIGHTPIEVIIGAIIGSLLAIILI